MAERFSTVSCDHCSTKLAYPGNTCFIQCPKCSNTIIPQPATTTYINCIGCGVLLCHPLAVSTIQCPKCEVVMELPSGSLNSDSNGGDTGNRKVRKKKRDPYAPKRASNAYMIFCKGKRNQLKKSRPDLPFGQLGSSLGQIWRTMSPEEKKPYETRAFVDRERYRKEMALYHQRQTDTHPDFVGASTAERDVSPSSPSASGVDSSPAHPQRLLPPLSLNEPQASGPASDSITSMNITTDTPQTSSPPRTSSSNRAARDKQYTHNNTSSSPNTQEPSVRESNSVPDPFISSNIDQQLRNLNVDMPAPANSAFPFEQKQATGSELDSVDPQLLQHVQQQQLQQQQLFLAQHMQQLQVQQHLQAQAVQQNMIMNPNMASMNMFGMNPNMLFPGMNILPGQQQPSLQQVQQAHVQAMAELNARNQMNTDTFN